jgi:hypothetical protein
MKIVVQEVNGAAHELELSPDGTLDDLIALLRPDDPPPLPQFEFCIGGKFLNKERPFANLREHTRIIAYCRPPAPPPPPEPADPAAGLNPQQQEILNTVVALSRIDSLYNPAHNIWANAGRVAAISHLVNTPIGRAVIDNQLRTRYAAPIRYCEAQPSSIFAALGARLRALPQGVPDHRAGIEAFSNDERRLFMTLAQYNANEEARYNAMVEAEFDEEVAVGLLMSMA